MIDAGCYVNIFTELTISEVGGYRFYSSVKGDETIMLPLLRSLSGLNVDELVEYFFWLGFDPTTEWDPESLNYGIVPGLPTTRWEYRYGEFRRLYNDIVEQIGLLTGPGNDCFVRMYDRAGQHITECYGSSNGEPIRMIPFLRALSGLTADELVECLEFFGFIEADEISAEESGFQYYVHGDRDIVVEPAKKIDSAARKYAR